MTLICSYCHKACGIRRTFYPDKGNSYESSCCGALIEDAGGRKLSNAELFSHFWEAEHDQETC